MSICEKENGKMRIIKKKLGTTQGFFSLETIFEKLKIQSFRSQKFQEFQEFKKFYNVVLSIE